MVKILSKLGEQQLVMVNYACGFNQSETGKYFEWIITGIIIWLAPRAGKMNQIARCDWLPEPARWSHLARSGLPTISRKQNFTKSHIINPLLTKLVG